MTIFKSLIIAATLLFLTASASHSTPPRCLIVGDSIAVGLSWHLKLCPVIAKVGISSKAVLNRTKPATIVIVSAGPMIRRTVVLKPISWPSGTQQSQNGHLDCPSQRRAAALVRKVAHLHGDQLVTFTAGRDGVHPKSYKRLARHVASNLHLLLERL